MGKMKYYDVIKEIFGAEYFTVKELIDVLRVRKQIKNDTSVRNGLSRLVRSNKIERLSCGAYRLTRSDGLQTYIPKDNQSEIVDEIRRKYCLPKDSFYILFTIEKHHLVYLTLKAKDEVNEKISFKGVEYDLYIKRPVIEIKQKSYTSAAFIELAIFLSDHQGVGRVSRPSYLAYYCKFLDQKKLIRIKRGTVVHYRDLMGYLTTVSDTLDKIYEKQQIEKELRAFKNSEVNYLYPTIKDLAEKELKEKNDELDWNLITYYYSDLSALIGVIKDNYLKVFNREELKNIMYYSGLAKVFPAEVLVEDAILEIKETVQPRIKDRVYIFNRGRKIT